MKQNKPLRSPVTKESSYLNIELPFFAATIKAVVPYLFAEFTLAPFLISTSTARWRPKRKNLLYLSHHIWVEDVRCVTLRSCKYDRLIVICIDTLIFYPFVEFSDDPIVSYKWINKSFLKCFGPTPLRPLRFGKNYFNFLWFFVPTPRYNLTWSPSKKILSLLMLPSHSKQMRRF